MSQTTAQHYLAATFLPQLDPWDDGGTSRQVGFHPVELPASTEAKNDVDVVWAPVGAGEGPGGRFAPMNWRFALTVFAKDYPTLTRFNEALRRLIHNDPRLKPDAEPAAVVDETTQRQGSTLTVLVR